MKDSKSIKVLTWNPRNKRELGIELNFQPVIDKACSIDSLADHLKKRLADGDQNPVFGYKPSYFYDIDSDWYWIHVYHKDKDLQRKRVLFSACLSGMENQVPSVDLQRTMTAPRRKGGQKC